MNSQFHILNGDALLAQFPKSIPGERIVARECLIEGNVKGETLEVFFENRANFIHSTYSDDDSPSYFQKVVPEFQKMLEIPSGSEVNLWFEDDLFCQANLWFVIYLFSEKNTGSKLFLVRPKKHTPYAFGGLSSAELLAIYKTRKELTNLHELSKLWRSYQNDNFSELKAIGKSLHLDYPFLLPAIKAHCDRFPKNGLDRPSQSLIKIMRDLKTEEFVPIFRAFWKQEAIYGFGDMQVKRLYDEIIKKSLHK